MQERRHEDARQRRLAANSIGVAPEHDRAEGSCQKSRAENRKGIEQSARARRKEAVGNLDREKRKREEIIKRLFAAYLSET